jgi:hypothetical protein
VYVILEQLALVMTRNLPKRICRLLNLSGARPLRLDVRGVENGGGERLSLSHLHLIG